MTDSCCLEDIVRTDEDGSCCLVSAEPGTPAVEMSDEAFYNLGRPNWYGAAYTYGPGGKYADQDRAGDAFDADFARYGRGYEEATGLTFNPCTC